MRPLVPVNVGGRRKDGSDIRCEADANAGGECHGRVRRRRPGDHGAVPRRARPDRGGGGGAGLARRRGRGHLGNPPEPRAGPGAAGHPRHQCRGRAWGADLPGRGGHARGPVAREDVRGAQRRIRFEVRRGAVRLVRIRGAGGAGDVGVHHAVGEPPPRAAAHPRRRVRAPRRGAPQPPLRPRRRPGCRRSAAAHARRGGAACGAVAGGVRVGGARGMAGDPWHGLHLRTPRQRHRARRALSGAAGGLAAGAVRRGGRSRVPRPAGPRPPRSLPIRARAGGIGGGRG